MDLEEYLDNTKDYLFEEFSLLESFSWVQYSNEEEDFVAESDDFTINEEAYWGENSIWKQDVNSYLRSAFDEIAPEDLQAMFGTNVKVTITRNDTITTPYFVS